MRLPPLDDDSAADESDDVASLDVVELLDAVTAAVVSLVEGALDSTDEVPVDTPETSSLQAA